MFFRLSGMLVIACSIDSNSSAHTVKRHSLDEQRQGDYYCGRERGFVVFPCFLLFRQGGHSGGSKKRLLVKAG